MRYEHLIERIEHNYFRGWRVATKRQGKRFVRYFSDKPKGRNAALRAARAYRDELTARLPPTIESEAEICPQQNWRCRRLFERRAHARRQANATLCRVMAAA
jgi:hypothetical protein